MPLIVGTGARLILGAALSALSCNAAAEPFSDADLTNGKEVHETKRCAACHSEETGRDETFIYLRDDRKVKTLFDLRRTVSMCNMQLQLGLFPEDERDVAAYLNHHFCKLKR